MAALTLLTAVTLQDRLVDRLEQGEELALGEGRQEVVFQEYLQVGIKCWRRSKSSWFI